MKVLSPGMYKKKEDRVFLKGIKCGVIHASWEWLRQIDLSQDVLLWEFSLLKKLARGCQIPWCSLLPFKLCQDL